MLFLIAQIRTVPAWVWLATAGVLSGGAPALAASGIESDPPVTHHKTLVFIGSSTTAGYGCTNLNHAWTYRLQTNLQTRGWTVTNLALSGFRIAESSNALFNPWYLPAAKTFHPDVIVVAQTLFNDGTTNYASRTRAQLRRLVETVRQLGAAPVVVSQWPWRGANPTDAEVIYAANDEIENWNAPVINHLDAVDDGTFSGHPFPWLVFDSLHLNDRGHDELYHSIPVSMFENAGAWDFRGIRLTRGYMSSGPALASQGGDHAGAECDPAFPLQSFTFSFWLKCEPTTPDQSGLACVYPRGGDTLGGWRLAKVAPRYQFSPGALPALTLTSQAPVTGWNHFALVFNHANTNCIIYLNGVSNCSWFDPGLGAVEHKVFGLFSTPGATGSGARDVSLKDVAVYRTCLNRQRVLRSYNGDYPKASLEVFAPLDDPKPATTSALKNLAPSKTRVITGMGSNRRQNG